MTEGDSSNSGVSFSQVGRRKERLLGSRSTITGWALAVAISRARLSRLQELVGELLQVTGRLGDVLVLQELPHLIVDAVREVRWRGRSVRGTRYQRVGLELRHELLGDRIEEARGHVGPGGDRAFLRVEGSLPLLRAADLEPADRVVAVLGTLGQPERVADDHVLARRSGRGHRSEVRVRHPVLRGEVAFGPVTHD